MIKNYELGCLISSKLDETERETSIQNIKDLIEEKGGEAIKISSSREVVLGYPINKETKAHLVVFVFNNCNESLTELKKEIEKKLNVLRCFVKKISRTKIEPVPQKRSSIKRTIKKEKVELKDLDKKIEEIFNPTKEEKKAHSQSPLGQEDLKENELQ